jgi:uncharacterized membrane protein
MKPLIVLLVTFGAAWLVYWYFGVDRPLDRAGRTGMAVMLGFTALGHFLYPDGMAKMLPPKFPSPITFVYLSGALEIVAAVGLLLPTWRKTTALMLILFFVLVLPANIYAARHHVDFQKGNYNGPGPGYLFFRIPLQILFIAWVYFFAYR